MLKKIIILFFGLLLFPQPAFAFEIVSDPQYIVINFSDTFHFLDWSAPEEVWQKEVKPQAMARLENLRNKLFYPKGTGNYVLAWSTLMEYTNYPLDAPSASSPYVVRLRRMLELAETEDFPIFIPLNGFQWWDELPELWNYWDPDGNQTPRCTNADHVNCPFAKLRDPAYRTRFIRGYNPNNRYNVDWSDWSTPLRFVTRNWGGGDVYVAPPPNIVASPAQPNSFAALQTSRYQSLVKVVAETVERWHQKNKDHLFAGISIGTEVSFYQSLNPKATNMQAYGYRAIQDVYCPPTNLNCGASTNWDTPTLNQYRFNILSSYFTSLAKIAHDVGIPRERVYTHSWNEKDGTDGDPSYSDNFRAGLTLYSRPGQSLYKLSADPFGFSLIRNTLADYGYEGWAAPEFSPLNKDDTESWKEAFTKTYISPAPPRVIDLYNEKEIINTGAIPTLKELLNQPVAPPPSCSIIPATPIKADIDPLTLSWQLLKPTFVVESQDLYLWLGEPSLDVSSATHHFSLPPDTTTFELPTTVLPGSYSWLIKRSTCDSTHWRISNPSSFTLRTWKERSLRENYRYYSSRLKQSLAHFFAK